MRVTAIGDVRVVLVTVPTRKKGIEMGRRLVEERLAACVNVVPGLTSVYRWKGKVCEDAEALMVIKTTRKRLDTLAAKVKEMHEYECPEVLSLDPREGSDGYVDWLREETS